MKTPSEKRKAAALIATALAVPAEGLRQFAYYDPPGILTVCYGSTTNVKKGIKYSLEECKSRLDSDMLSAVNEVDACVPGLPEEVLAAFADAAYNIGGKVACDRKNSAAARYLYAGKLIEACNQLPRWDKARIAGMLISLPGLTTRRGAEQELCLRGAT